MVLFRARMGISRWERRGRGGFELLRSDPRWHKRDLSLPCRVRNPNFPGSSWELSASLLLHQLQGLGQAQPQAQTKPPPGLQQALPTQDRVLKEKWISAPSLASGGSQHQCPQMVVALRRLENS